MSRLIVVVDHKKDWTAYYPTEDLMSVQEYLALNDDDKETRTQVINLCKSYRYLSYGYYCSLLAEARHHHVIPSVKTLNNLRSKSLYSLDLEELNKALDSIYQGASQNDRALAIKIYFGTTPIPELKEWARHLFELFPAPILEVQFSKREHWLIDSVKSVSLQSLSEEEETHFANSFDIYSRKIWRKPRLKKKYRYDLAILHNPQEKLPPSDRTALKKFIRAGRRLGIDVDLIEKKDFVRLAEYDALFIRETTTLLDHTYRFAKKAESEGMIVIDDPNSILRCTNKIYLADLLRTHKINCPKTIIINRDQKNAREIVAQEVGFPAVLKIPDGSFSRGIVRVDRAEDFHSKAEQLFKQSALLLVQEYLYTEFDWRIGILNHKPIFACRYYMAKNHWQIYDHSGGGKTVSGGFDTLPTYEVPKKILNAALAAARHIGDGLYGVDLKEKNGKPFVIEVNDNPNIDSGVEDKYLGDELYHIIMEDFLRRLEKKRTEQ